MPTITCKIPTRLKIQLEALARGRRVSNSAILRAALETATKKSSARLPAPSAYDLVQNLCGALRGPRDLSTNPKHLKGFGE